ncbi:cation-translocating P-type ATPase [Thermoactinospora rubra]|uniref:cation-translocating P-type ATPase n=1 Tax=Thermoactinospora rubra TaxID=1088767 RepID=UPI000A11D2B9|nr:cation-transporting P-type ATPase [Thermoactinospora rubra]
MASVTAGTAGLTSQDAARRLAADGPNTLPPPRRSPPVLLLAREMVHFFALLLWGAALLAWWAGMPQLAAAIVVVVLLNGAFAFAQEYRADKAAQRLGELVPADVVVRRDGRRRVIRAADLVVGDVVLLEAGDRVPADLELSEAHGLAVNTSMLTGESVPDRPSAGEPAFAGTFVVEGQAEGVVTATGTHTRLASIAALTLHARRPPSPLAVQLGKVVRIVALIAAGVGVAFFGLAVLLGMDPADGFLFALGVTVALVPEGLLPTVTLSLARAAQRMAARNALVRHLEAVETLGSATFICTDKTGTLTRNEMTVAGIWGVERDILRSAVLASTGRMSDGKPVGDPMEVALHVAALRAGVDVDAEITRRIPFDPVRRRAAVVAGGELHVKGAPDSVLPLCPAVPGAQEALARMSERGLRVLAVARGAGEEERDLTLLGLVGLEDPPRDDVAEAIATCRTAGIKLAMVTGDHPGTARAIAAEVGLLGPDRLVVTGDRLPGDDAALGELLDRDGVVVARVTPEDKLRIARALRRRGHVVAMTGDGVNDGPALREADIGIAMGASGTDVAREAADVVLLDDHFATIVAAVELGRATYANIRRFLTYHLTDNVAELTPFVAWALSGGTIPLALSVLQILALDIGTDLLPALALGAEPPNPRTMQGPARAGALIDRRLLVRVFGVLGPAQALVEMAAFLGVLAAGGGLAAASGTAFAAVALGQFANAFACRSETRWVGLLRWPGNRLLIGAVAAEAVIVLAFLGVPWLSAVLGGAFPPPLGWALAALAIPAVIGADALHKGWRAARSKDRGSLGR